MGMSSGSEPPSSPTVSGQTLAAGESVADFAAHVLDALMNIAARNNRGQADVTAALRRAGLPIDVPRVRAALHLLQTNGYVTNLVPLADGGLLLTVDKHAFDRRMQSPWLDERGATDEGNDPPSED